MDKPEKPSDYADLSAYIAVRKIYQEYKKQTALAKQQFIQKLLKIRNESEQNEEQKLPNQLMKMTHLDVTIDACDDIHQHLTQKGWVRTEDLAKELTEFIGRYDRIQGHFFNAKMQRIGLNDLVFSVRFMSDTEIELVEAEEKEEAENDEN